MGMVQKRKKMHYGDTHLQRRWRVRNRRRDLDQIDDDLRTQSAQLINQSVDLEKPGFAQFYCVHCAKYFIDDQALQAHFRTKVHKRRMKALETEPYTAEDAERAAGHGSYKEPKKRVMETQPSKDEVVAGKRIKLEEQQEVEKKVVMKKVVEKGAVGKKVIAKKVIKKKVVAKKVADEMKMEL